MPVCPQSTRKSCLTTSTGEPPPPSLVSLIPLRVRFLPRTKFAILPVLAFGRVSRKAPPLEGERGGRPSRKGHVGDYHHDSGGLGTGRPRYDRSDHAYSGLFPVWEGVRCRSRRGRSRSDPLR